MSQMILLYQAQQNELHIQIGDHDDYATFNLTLCQRENGKPVAYLTGFGIPTLCSYNIFKPRPDKYSKTISDLVKILPIITDKIYTVPAFINLLVKRFKVTKYQFNVNSCFDCSDLKDWQGRTSSLNVAREISRLGFPLVLTDY